MGCHKKNRDLRQEVAVFLLLETISGGAGLQ